MECIKCTDNFSLYTFLLFQFFIEYVHFLKVTMKGVRKISEGRHGPSDSY